MWNSNRPMKIRLISLTLLIIVLPNCLVLADIQKKSADSYYQKALAAFEKGDVDKAADLMEKALDLTPANCEYHWVLGNLQGDRAQEASILTKIGKAKSCKQHWEWAIELCPDSVKYLESLMRFHLQAPGIAGGSKDEAGKLLQLIYALDSTRGCWVEFEIAIGEKNYTTARDILDQMMAAGLDTLNALRGIGDLSNYFLKDYGVAQTYYLRVLAVEPDDWAITYQAGRTAILSGKSTREAIGHMRHYLSHPTEKGHPSHAAAYWRMGMAYEQLPDPDSAYFCYETSLRLEPEFKEARESLKTLKKKTNR